MTVEDGTNPEIKIEIVRDKMNNSAELAKNPIKDGEPGYDKVYIQAAGVSHDNNNWVVQIDSSSPTVVLNDKLKDELKLSNSPTVNEIRDGNGKRILVSGGSWVWIEDSQGNLVLPLLRRDSGAPTDANCLTGPAGRCGEKLSQTTVDETNQEFMFLQADGDNGGKLLVFYRNEEDKEDVIHQKLRQVETIRKSLMDKYEKQNDK